MSRFVAIAQELKIPVFGVVDGDSDAKPDDMEKNRIDNECLLNLFSLRGEERVPDATIWGEDLVVWARRIGDTVIKEFGNAWGSAESRVRNDQELWEGVKRKNAMLIGGTLEELWKEGKPSASLIRLCGAILRFAEKAGQ